MAASIVAYVVSNALGGGLAGAIGGAIAGAAVSSLLAPTQKVTGPRLGDLSVTSSAYGSVLPHVEGHPRIGGQVIHASQKREIATTTRSGKGGGGVKTTTFTYEVDLLIALTANEIEGVLRVWEGGDLVFNQTSDATYETLLSSLASPHWDRLTVYGGAADQLPDPDYEAAVGTANAPAYRGRGTVFIKGLKLGQSGQIPNMTFEVVRSSSEHYSKAFFADDVTYDLGMAPATDDINTVDIVYPLYIESTLIKFGTTSLKRKSLVGSKTPSVVVNQNLFKHNFTMEAWIRVAAYPGSGKHINIMGLSPGTESDGVNPWYVLRLGSDGKIYPRVYDNVTTFTGQTIFLNGGPSLTGNVTKNPAVIPLDTWVHVVLQREEEVWSTICNGTEWAHTWEDTGGGNPYLEPGSVVGNYGNLAVYWQDYYDDLVSSGQTGMYLKVNGGSTGTTGAANKGSTTFDGAALVYMDGFRLSDVARYPELLGYEIPTVAPKTDDDAVTIYNFNNLGALLSNDPTISEVVSDLCLRSGLTAGQIDVTGLSVITTKVHGLVVSQVSPTRSVLEMLMACYFFDVVLYDKLHFRPRAAAAAVTIPYEDFGFADDGSMVEVLPLSLNKEVKLPGQLALTYNNIDGDWQTDTQYSNRVDPSQDSIEVVQVAMGFTAAEAKIIVEARHLDRYVALRTSEIALSLAYSKYVPTDVVTVIGKNGSRYRFRIDRRTDTANRLVMALVLDDATVFTQLGLTTGGTDEQSIVLAIPDTVLYLMDAPLLGDLFDMAGIYVAVKGERADWTQAGIYHSLDDVSFTLDQTMSTEAVAGVCTDTLQDWTGGKVFDEMSSVTVNIDRGELSSVTRAQLLNDQSFNLAMVGAEVLQFRSAELLSAGLYKLTGLLRGRRGTDWAMEDHAASEDFVLLTSDTVRFFPLSNSDLARTRYYKGVTAGQTLSAVESEAITPMGVALKPFSPVHIGVDREGAEPVVSWIRRTRYATRVGGALPQSIPLGEATEAYEVDVYADDTFTTVVETIATTTPSTPVSEIGSPAGPICVAIYQMSAAVGRGYPARAVL